MIIILSCLLIRPVAPQDKKLHYFQITHKTTIFFSSHFCDFCGSPPAVKHSHQKNCEATQNYVLSVKLNQIHANYCDFTAWDFFCNFRIIYFFPHMAFDYYLIVSLTFFVWWKMSKLWFCLLLASLPKREKERESFLKEREGKKVKFAHFERNFPLKEREKRVWGRENWSLVILQRNLLHLT